jgi:hypothetical protein
MSTASPVLGEELSKRAEERQQQVEGSAFKLALQVPSEAHGALSGQPCWKLDSSRGICEERLVS